MSSTPEILQGLPEIQWQERLDRIRRKMADDGVDVLMVTGLPSLAYVGNFYQSFAWYVHTAVLVAQDGPTQAVLPLADVARVSRETWIKDLVAWNPPMPRRPEQPFEELVANFIRATAGRIAKGRAVRVGIEANVTWQVKSRLDEILGNTVEWVNGNTVLTPLMVIKEPAEIERMRRVAKICEVGLEAGLNALRTRAAATEVQLVGFIEKAMRDAGCEGYWVPNQAGTGTTVLLDHYPTNAVIEDDHIVKMGFHPCFQLYCGDICNTVSLAKPTPAFERLAKTCSEATMACIDALAPGKVGAEIHQEFHRIMDKAGYGDYSTWYIGHGLGTGHQPPFISSESRDVLEPGMIVVINTMAVKPNEPGIVLETMCLITETGYERLTNNPMELVVLDD